MSVIKQINNLLTRAELGARFETCVRLEPLTGAISGVNSFVALIAENPTHIPKLRWYINHNDIRGSMIIIADAVFEVDPRGTGNMPDLLAADQRGIVAIVRFMSDAGQGEFRV